MTPNSSLTFIPNRLVQDKDQSRKLIELRLFTRIDGKDGLAKSKGISNVNDQVKQTIKPNESFYTDTQLAHI